MELTLLWATLTGVGFAWAGIKLWPERLPDRPLDRIIMAAAIGLLVGRLWAMIGQGVSPLSNPADIIIVRGGVSTGAATAGALIAYLWGVKWRPAQLDAIAPAALAGLAGWHAGCLWRGACLGTASDLPWAWAQAGSSITRHPVELYAAVGLLIAGWAVSKLGWETLTRSGVALASAGLVRLATEPMRPSLGGGPVEIYVAAITIGVIAVLLGGRSLTNST